MLLQQGIEGQFARGYLSNVCVANELHRNGLGYDLVAKSKAVAQKWGKNLLSHFQSSHTFSNLSDAVHAHCYMIL